MLSDARTIPPGTVLSADVCIVGAGPAGITIAEELAGDGRKVVVLEAGSVAEHRETQRLARGIVDQHYYPLERTRIMALGGSSNHWMLTTGMRARRLDPLDLQARPDVGRPGWPYGIEVLEPFYDRAEASCRLPGTGWDLGQVRVKGESPPPSADGFDPVLFRIAPLDNWPARARALPDLPGVHVVTRAAVEEVVLSRSGSRVHGVVVARPGGGQVHVTSRTTVLAAGGIENPRLLLASHNRRPAGIGNGHDHVGRWFAEHPHISTGILQPTGPDRLDGLKPFARRCVAGIDHMAMLAPSAATLQREGLLNCVWELQVAPSAMLTPAGRATKELREAVVHRRLTVGVTGHAAAVARHPVATMHALMAWGAKRRSGRIGGEATVGMHIMTEQAPNADSRVTLANGRDDLGRHVAKLRWRLTSLDQHTIQRSQELLAAALVRSGQFTFDQPFLASSVREQIGGGYHHLGTTRMAAAPGSGVVDADGKVHEVEDLYVTGTSVIPAGGYANPTLTVVALALKLAHHLSGRLAQP